MSNILLDTCIWIAFYDEREKANHPKMIESILKNIEIHKILFPWPVAYEAINTRLTRNKKSVSKFLSVINSRKIEFIDDERYKRDAFDLSLNSTLNGKGSFSMVDSAIRLIIEDKNVRTDSLITFNGKDFYDVCAKNKVELITQNSKW